MLASLHSTNMPKQFAIALWSLGAACLVAFGIAALVSPH